jgi:3-oxoacyl-[acyl-carrier-protein] synthase-1/3-oxoacyl-[acyl-carrier-protein] synthase II
MTTRVFITGMGIVSPLGCGCDETAAALVAGKCHLEPLSLFPVAHDPALPVGQVENLLRDEKLPRTHQLAITAAQEAMEAQNEPPDAIIVGTTTGGMLHTETLLKSGCTDPSTYQYHAPHTVSGAVADRFNFNGPTFTVSTACASALTALHLAVLMLKSGRARRVLVGGTDALSRLTYYGFSALQLIDPQGARPCDRDRRGMSVAEAAAFLLMEAAEVQPDRALGQVLGSGLSCDAHHVTQPHPQGKGARLAMQAALNDAGLKPNQIDHVSMHGTGTPDNDAAEALAIGDLFGSTPPPYCSSIKGAIGHSLAAVGTVTVVATLLAMRVGFMPATTGCRNLDPALVLEPLTKSKNGPFERALVNAFGFGGNNGSAVIADAAYNALVPPAPTASGTMRMSVIAHTCRTGAGDLGATMQYLENGCRCGGCLANDQLDTSLPIKKQRRLKRLPRMVSGLVADILAGDSLPTPPECLVFGTAWGALTETWDFLTNLFAHGERFPSPIDFVGSVHNAPAGQVAMRHRITGPNITITGGEHSFEQAFQAACLQGAHSSQNTMLISADEYHPDFSPLLDPQTSASNRPADGGGAFYLSPHEGDRPAPTIELCYYGQRIRSDNPEDVRRQIRAESMQARRAFANHGDVAAVLYGGTSAMGGLKRAQLQAFQQEAKLDVSYIDYRQWLGHFPTVNAAAVSVALRFLSKGRITGMLSPENDVIIGDKTVLVLTLGDRITLFVLKMS